MRVSLATVIDLLPPGEQEFAKKPCPSFVVLTSRGSRNELRVILEVVYPLPPTVIRPLRSVLKVGPIPAVDVFPLAAGNLCPLLPCNMASLSLALFMYIYAHRN